MACHHYGQAGCVQHEGRKTHQGKREKQKNKGLGRTEIEMIIVGD